MGSAFCLFFSLLHLGLGSYRIGPRFSSKEEVVLNSHYLPGHVVSLTPDEKMALNRLWLVVRKVDRTPLVSPDYFLISGKSVVRIWRYHGVAQEEKGAGFVLPPRSVTILDLPVTRWHNEVAEKWGELVPWHLARLYLPKFGRARVVDFLTGLEFEVERRGGTDHADVQPLTARDTEVMKKIYGGRWSWERRAVIVVAGGHRMAASMNGQPHGEGAIKGNNFPGHFCLHFWQSRVHRSGLVDIEHQRRVLEAAGRL